MLTAMVSDEFDPHGPQTPFPNHRFDSSPHSFYYPGATSPRTASKNLHQDFSLDTLQIKLKWNEWFATGPVFAVAQEYVKESCPMTVAKIKALTYE